MDSESSSEKAISPGLLEELCGTYLEALGVSSSETRKGLLQCDEASFRINLARADGFGQALAIILKHQPKEIQDEWSVVWKSVGGSVSRADQGRGRGGTENSQGRSPSKAGPSIVPPRR